MYTYISLFYNWAWFLFGDYLWKFILQYFLYADSKGLHLVHRHRPWASSPWTPSWMGPHQWCVGKCVVTRSLRKRPCWLCLLFSVVYTLSGVVSSCPCDDTDHIVEKRCVGLIPMSRWFQFLLLSLLLTTFAKFIPEASHQINVTACV